MAEKRIWIDPLESTRTWYSAEDEVVDENNWIPYIPEGEVSEDSDPLGTDLETAAICAEVLAADIRRGEAVADWQAENIAGLIRRSSEYRVSEDSVRVKREDLVMLIRSHNEKVGAGSFADGALIRLRDALTDQGKEAEQEEANRHERELEERRSQARDDQGKGDGDE